MNIDTPTLLDQWWYALFSQVTDGLVTARSQQTRIPSQYVRDIQSGIGISDRRINLPTGIQVPNNTTKIEEETDDTGQIELAMAAAISEIKVIDPLSLDEAMKRPDKTKWEIVIKEELENLKRAGTWNIVERPREKNILKNKWVFRIKKNSLGEVKQYKARLVAKGYIQISGVNYYNTWAPVAKLRLIQLILATAAQNQWPIDMFNFHSADKV